MGTSPATEAAAPSSSRLMRVRRLADRPWKMLIGGELRDARAGQSIPAVYPGDGTPVGKFPAGDAADVDDAVAAAKAASAAWADAVADRAQLLLALADAVEEHGDELAWIDTFDNGSPITVMRNDFAWRRGNSGISPGSPFRCEERPSRSRRGTRSTSRSAIPSELSAVWFPLTTRSCSPLRESRLRCSQAIRLFSSRPSKRRCQRSAWANSHSTSSRREY